MARSRKQRNKLEYAGPAPAVAADDAPRGPSRRALLIACVVVCLAVAFAYAGGGWASVLYRLLVDGAVLAAWLACATGMGAVILLALPVRNPAIDPPGDHTLLHLVTAAALGMGTFSLAALGLGLAGWLNLATAAGLLLLGGSLGVASLARSSLWRDRTQASELLGAWLRGPAGWSWLWLAAMPFLGLAIVVALLPPGLMWPEEPHGYDVVEYHLQIPREWYEIGRIVPLRHNAFSFFPFNVEMHFLLAMHLRGGSWAGMYLAHFMHLAMVVLTVAAVYGFARRLSASPRVAVIAALAVATTPWLTQLGSVAYNEGGLLLFGTLAMGWAFDAAVRPARLLGRFPVAGLLAGFACGSKLTGVPEVLFAVGGLCAIGILLDHRTSRGRSEERAEPRIEPREPSADIRGSAPLRPRLVGENTVPLALRLIGVSAFFLAGVLAFAPWLVRNQVWAGNPVFPEAARLLGQAHFSDAQVERWEQAHAPRPDQRSPAVRIRAWWSGVWTNWQYGYLLLPLGVATGMVVALAPRLSRQAVAGLDSDPAPALGTPRATALRPGASEAPVHFNVPKHIRLTALMLAGMFVGLSVIWLGFTHLQGRFFILAVPIAGLLVALLPARRAAVLVVAVLVGAAAGPGYARLHGLLAHRFTAEQRAALIGFEQLSAALVPAAAEQVPADAPVALAGDARAFVYEPPAGRLFYRTVFDVDAKPGQSVIDAWTAGAPAGAWVLVDPVELKRFHQTYKHIPPLPPETAGRREAFPMPPAGGAKPAD